MRRLAAPLRVYRGPAKDAASYYVQASESGGESPGRSGGGRQGRSTQLAAALLPVLQATDEFIAHAAGPIEGGYRVTELRESEAAHSAWFAAHVAPGMTPGATPPIITTRPITKIAIRA